MTRSLLRWLALLCYMWTRGVIGQSVSDGSTSWSSSNDDEDWVFCRVANCQSCRIGNYDHCEECERGYFVAAGGQCEACSLGCAMCKDATRCSKCMRGYRIEGFRCEACQLPGCASCNAGVSTCDGCYWHMHLVAERCVLAWSRIFVVAVLVALSVLYLWLRGSKHAGPPEACHRAFVGDTYSLDTSYPSGLWKGYYTQHGEQHALLEFDLLFRSDGRVSGRGRDDVGQFAIKGLHANRRVAFTKTYDSTSANDAGVRVRGNRGHSVEYRAQPASATIDLGLGLIGNWSIEAYDVRGTFRLWPVELPQVNQASSPASARGDCAICFEPKQLAKLHPCGHVAFCKACLDRLPSPRRCPLCRTYIAHILTSSLITSA